MEQGNRTRRTARSRHAILAIWLATACLTACSSKEQASAPQEPEQESIPEGPLKGAVTLERLPKPTDPNLILGAKVWDGTCRGCHGLGIADSPKITDKAAWAPRIAQGVETLYQHALEGHFGSDGAMMPSRGGNDALSDEEVKAAVNFMISNSQ